MPPLTAAPASPAAGPRARRTTRTARERGQVLVIFAGAMIALVALCAVVVDVVWYWTSNLRMQRAADAAALAGVVWLPGNQLKASSVARDEAVVAPVRGALARRFARRGDPLPRRPRQTRSRRHHGAESPLR